MVRDYRLLVVTGTFDGHWSQGLLEVTGVPDGHRGPWSSEGPVGDQEGGMVSMPPPRPDQRAFLVLRALFGLEGAPCGLHGPF